MIKQLSLAVLVTALITGCGGSSGGNDSKSSSSTPAPASSVASSSEAPASSATSSSESSAASSLPSADLSYGFEEGIEGWYINGSASDVVVTSELELSHDMVNDALAITPLDWSVNADTNWFYQARLDFANAENLADSRLKYVVSIPQAYIVDTALELQLIVYADEVDYGITFALSAVTVDENGDYIVERTTNVASATGIGFQLAKAPTDTSIKEPILVKSILIDRPEGSASSSTNSSSSSSDASNQLSIPVNSLDGWNNDGTPATFSLNDGIAVTPHWDVAEQTAMYILSAPIDLTNATVTYVIHVPAAYITDGGMAVQPFSQQNSGSYTGIFDGDIPGGWNPASSLTAGDNTIVHGPFVAPPADIQRVGVKLQKGTMGNGVTGDIIIRSITVQFPE